jgi:hypothetical protein
VSPQSPALVEFQRSGGIAGQTTKLVVQENGEALLFARGDTVDREVPGDTLARLKTLLQGIPFDALRAEYQPPQSGADRYEYTIAHRGHRVRMYDGTVPPEVQPLIDVLNGLVRSRR